MWWYNNILGYNKGSISDILRPDTITQGYVLITINPVALTKENHEPILTVKITAWRKFVDYFGLSIEADPSKVVRKNVYIFHIGYITRPSSVKIRISRHHMDK